MLPCQPLPTPGTLASETGYYPEVAQHTTWDYGRNGMILPNNILFGTGQSSRYGSYTAPRGRQKILPEQVQKNILSYNFQRTFK